VADSHYDYDDGDLSFVASLAPKGYADKKYKGNHS